MLEQEIQTKTWQRVPTTRNRPASIYTPLDRHTYDMHIFCQWRLHLPGRLHHSFPSRQIECLAPREWDTADWRGYIGRNLRQAVPGEVHCMAGSPLQPAWGRKMETDQVGGIAVRLFSRDDGCSASCATEEKHLGVSRWWRDVGGILESETLWKARDEAKRDRDVVEVHVSFHVC